MAEKSSPAVEPKDVSAYPPKYFRLNKAYQFKELSQHGRSYRTADYLIRFLPKKSGGLGFAVKATKKNFKKAHDRNYAKRRLRHLIYTTQPQIHGHMILVANKSIAHTPYATLLADFSKIISSFGPSKPHQDQIEIKAYDPTWPAKAALEIANLKEHLPFPWITDIQHFGSTAVPGIPAKPVIDIMIGVININETAPMIPIMKQLNYQFWTGNPKKDRLFFVKGMPPFGEKRTHHAHVFQKNSYEWFVRPAFRDYLIAHEDTKEAYAILKKDLANQHTHDREAYTDAKKEFIQATVQKAALSLVHFKPLNKDHFPLLQQWFNTPHAQAFYSLRPWTLEEIETKYTPYTTGEKSIQGFIIYWNDYPIGYVQKYTVKDYPWPNQDLPQDVIDHAAGVDIVIGQLDFTGKGLGKSIWRLFLTQHIWPHYTHCIVDPDVQNTVSLKFFEGRGFKPHKDIQTQDALGKDVTLRLMLATKAG